MTAIIQRPADPEMAAMREWLHNKLSGYPIGRWVVAADLRSAFELEWDATLVFVEPGTGTPIDVGDEADVVACRTLPLNLCQNIETATVRVVAYPDACPVGRGGGIIYDYIACPPGLIHISTRISVAEGSGGPETDVLLPDGWIPGQLALAHGRYNEGGAQTPDEPAGWTAIGSGGQAGGAAEAVGGKGAFRILQEGDTNGGTWGDCHSVILTTWENFDTSDPIGGISGAADDLGTITWPALTLDRTDGTSHVVQFAVHANENVSDNTNSGSPSMTLLTSAAGGEHGMWYSGGGVTSWGAHTMSVVADDWVCQAYEIKQAP